MKMHKENSYAFLFPHAYDQSGLTVQEDYALSIFGVFANSFLFLFIFPPALVNFGSSKE